jgi:hypothetical protein
MRFHMRPVEPSKLGIMRLQLPGISFMTVRIPFTLYHTVIGVCGSLACFGRYHGFYEYVTYNSCFCGVTT